MGKKYVDSTVMDKAIYECTVPVGLDGQKIVAGAVKAAVDTGKSGRVKY